jgi:hypothetical protein
VSASGRPGQALIIDLPRGYQDDPRGCQGLAALVARLLASPARPGAARTAADRGWRTRHQLEAHRSSFAFWSQDEDVRAAVSAMATDGGARNEADEALLAQARAAQLALATQRSGSIFVQLGQASQQAAWGWSEPPPLGEPSTVEQLPADLVFAELAQLTNRLESHGADRAAAGPAAPTPLVDRTWQGGFAHVATGTEATRVSVRVPCAQPPVGALEVLVEVLGTGPEGRLYAALRGERGLAYGFSAGLWAQDGQASLAATASVRPEDAATVAPLLLAALRGVLDEPVGAAEFAAAARRCRARLLTSLDDPFAAVDESRRAALGRPLIGDVAAALGHLTPPTGLGNRPGRPAVAVVGPERAGQEVALVTRSWR